MHTPGVGRAGAGARFTQQATVMKIELLNFTFCPVEAGEEFLFVRRSQGLRSFGS